MIIIKKLKTMIKITLSDNREVLCKTTINSVGEYEIVHRSEYQLQKNPLQA